MKKIILLLAILIANKFSNAQINGNFTFESLNRTYITYVPTTYTSTSQMPLVFVLHGLTQTANNIMDYSGFNAIAEVNKFIVVYPNGTGFIPSWNSTIGAAGVNDYGFLNALLDTMLAKYSINSSRVYSCGFSNGGFMSNHLACKSNRFAAIAGVGGNMSDGTYTACNPVKKIPILHIHGTADAVVAYNGAVGINKSVDDVINYWNTKNTCPTAATITPITNLSTTDNSTAERIEYKPCAQNTEVQLIKITGGGHQWPMALSNSGVGATNMDVHASQEIWNFFNKFGIPTNLQNNNLQINEVSIVPNPTNNYLVINNSKPVKIIIKNMQGQIVLQTKYNGNTNVQNLVTGLYLIELLNEKNNIYKILKFVKQ